MRESAPLLRRRYSNANSNVISVLLSVSNLCVGAHFNLSFDRRALVDRKRQRLLLLSLLSTGTLRFLRFQRKSIALNRSDASAGGLQLRSLLLRACEPRRVRSISRGNERRCEKTE